MQAAVFHKSVDIKTIIEKSIVEFVKEFKYVEVFSKPQSF